MGILLGTIAGCGLAAAQAPVLVPSAMGLEIARPARAGVERQDRSVSNGKTDDTYTLPAVETRAYNDGVAFRYVVPKQDGPEELRIADESTQFAFAKDATTWPPILRHRRPGGSPSPAQ